MPMKPSCLLAFLLVFLLLLVGCGGREVPAPTAEPTAEPIEVPSPAPTAAPTPSPVPFTEGEALTAQGTELGPGLLYEGLLYARAEELFSALTIAAETAGEGLRFSWRGEDYVLSPDSAVLQCEHGDRPLEGPLLLSGGALYVPALSLCRTLDISVYHDEELGHWYFTPAAGNWPLPEGYEVPVLMYHAVSDELWGVADLFVSPASLAEQLQYLADEGYETIWFEDLEHIGDYEKPVILTFDDGYMDNYTELFPLLRQYGAKATVFIITGWMGGDVYLDAGAIREMSDSGLVSIQSHTLTHPHLSGQSSAERYEEYAQSKRYITRVTGKEPFVLCYPYGDENAQARAELAGFYRFGVKMGGPRYITGAEPTLVCRSYVTRGTSLETFAALLGR